MAEEKVKSLHRERTSSCEVLPPNMSELRLVLLGNSSSGTCSVGNFLLGQAVCRQSDRCEKSSGQYRGKNMVLVKTPDLLHPNLPEASVSALMEDCVELSAPGPHVFILVLQPEDFNEQQKTRLQSVLENFSDQAFQHSLLLLLPPRGGAADFLNRYRRQSPLKDLIKQCRFRYLKQDDMEKLELITRVGQIVKENNGEHVSSDGLHLTPQTDVKVQAQTDGSGLNLILLGNSWSQRSSVGNLLLKKPVINTETKPLNFQTYKGEMHNQPLTVVNTPDLQDTDRADFKDCIRSLSGPLVFLLVLQPEDFTEEHKNELYSVLQSCSDKAFDQSLVLIHMAQAETGVMQKLLRKRDPDDQHIRDMVIKCKYRYLYINSTDDLNQKEFTREELFTRIGQMLKENKENLSCGTSQEEDMGLNPAASEENRPCLNLVLCGRAGAEKSSVVESIFGQSSVCMSSEQCVGHQGKLCGRWVSLLELPPLSGSRKPVEELMEQCLRFLSRCGPQGIQAFLLVLPLDPLTDEDKSELRSIQDVFSSAVCPFTMILFTVDSDSYHPDEEGTDLQELCQPYAGQLIFNTRGQHRVDMLLDSLETFAKNQPHSYTTETLIYGQRRMITAVRENQDQHVKRTISGSEASADCLRIALMGRTGCGKSSSGNTILGRTQFRAVASSKSVTQSCEKAETDFDGRRITVVDTPGLLQNRMSNDYVIDEMTKCISLLAPGPHVFLLVLELGRFTEMNETIDLIRKSFGKESQKYTMILFTHGDKLEGESSIEEYMRIIDSSLKKLLSDCGNRFHLFNNEDQTNVSQAKELLKKIDVMVEENGGGCFTNDMFQHAEVTIKKEMERIMKEKEEEMRREREEMERKYQQEMEDIKLQMEKQREQTEKDRKQREQELREKEEKIKMEEEQRKKLEKIVKEKEEKMWREREEMERRYQQEMKEIKQEMEKQKEQMETEIKEREQELREKEEKIKMEEEQRKKEQEKRKEEERKRREQEERLRREWKQKQKELEGKIKSESESKEATQQKLEESRRKMEEQREKWEKEREEWWQKRKEENEEKEKQSKAREERQRQELEQKQNELEEKIKSESELKEATEQKLQESRRKMEEQRQKWENEREEWWQKRKQEGEERRQYIKNLCEEYDKQRLKDQDQRREEDRIRKQQEEEMKRKYQQEMEDIKLQMEKQKEQTEKDRKQREQELREKEEKIKMEEEQRRKEQENREEEERKRREQEERQRQELERRQKDLEEKIKSESESKEATEQKLEESRRKMEEQREKWEKEKEEWWQKRKREDEEKQQYIKILREEYDRQRLKDQEQRREEDRIRKQQEEENIEKLKKMYEKIIEDSIKASEKEARTRMEEEFQRKEKEKLEDHRKHINDLVKCICRKKHNVKRINEKLKADEEQMSKETDEEKKEALLKDQEKELSELIQEMLEEEDDSVVDKLLRWFR